MLTPLALPHTHTHKKRKGQPFFREFATKCILYFEQCSHKNSLILGWMFEAGPRSFRMMGGSEYINLRIHLCSFLFTFARPSSPHPPSACLSPLASDPSIFFFDNKILYIRTLPLHLFLLLPIKPIFVKQLPSFCRSSGAQSKSRNGPHP